ncbi:MAG TPA: serine/threonine-protein kinase [Gemmataceae bacterium]|nr:serine/threonine-protein kinase [Gemmataceae bacterium]
MATATPPPDQTPSSTPLAKPIIAAPPAPPPRLPAGLFVSDTIMPMPDTSVPPIAWSAKSLDIPLPKPPGQMEATERLPSLVVEPGVPVRADALPENTEIGPYRIKKLIGEGGMGLVYRAEDKYLRRAVALKMVKPDLAKDQRTLNLFLTEAQATAKLKDDRIATIYQVGEHLGQYFLAMELLSGESLEARLRRSPVPLPMALWIVREAALGLAVAHEANFVHRDIKPANLWLETASGSQPEIDPLQKFRAAFRWPTEETAYQRVKILDFGLVRLAQDEETRKKQKSVVGTPAYMAPEQAAGEKGDARSDLFSLGVVLFRMLTGRLPFSGRTALEILTSLATETAPLVSEFNPATPPSLVTLVKSLLSRKPDNRPQTAAELAAAIEVIERQLLAPPSPAPPTTKSTPRYGLKAAIGLSLGLASFAAGWYVLNSQSAPDPVTLATANATSSKGVLTPREAALALGDKVTVEFVVGAMKRSGDQFHLYEEPPKPDELTFRLVLPPHIISAMRKWAPRWPDSLNRATLRVHGSVYREGRFAEMLVSDVKQFDKLMYADGTDSKKRDKSAKDDSEQPLPPDPMPSRTPKDRESKELADSVEKATKAILAPFMGKDPPK